MTKCGFYTLLLAIFSGVLALTFTSAAYLYVSIALFLLLIYGLISALLACLTASAWCTVTNNRVLRGEGTTLRIYAQRTAILPVAPLKIRYSFGSVESEMLFQRLFSFQEYDEVFCQAKHVGQYIASVNTIIIADLFGFFSFPCKVEKKCAVLSLPRPFPIDKPNISTGDEGNAALNRSQEDYTSPDDLRSYRAGDAMKRVHWKLSVRKRELLVRKYEMPAPPDTLILLDCAEIENQENAEKAASVRDALCETAVAAAAMQMADGSPVRLPLYGEHANEFCSDRADTLTVLQEMLALQSFQGGEDFARVLTMELRRMRRTGATIIVTTRLDYAVTDAVISIRKMGPSARLYLVTHTPDAEKYAPFVQRLQHHLVEVCYVTPA